MATSAHCSRWGRGRVHIGAPDQNHVGAPVGEIEIAVRVEIADVAQRLPAALQRARFSADIAVRRRQIRISLHVNFADFAGRQLHAIRGKRRHQAW